MPFAGKYILGGKLHKLNNYRGVIDPIKIKKYDKSAIILDDFGRGEINLINGKISKLRNKPYSKKSISKRIKEVKKNIMNYEKDIKISDNKINFYRIIKKAYDNAILKSELKKNYYFLINITYEKKSVGKFIFNCNKKKNFFSLYDSKIKPASEIIIDYRYLFGLLTGLYHWNNAEVGSQTQVKRNPDVYSRSAQQFLNFMTCV